MNRLLYTDQYCTTPRCVLCLRLLLHPYIAPWTVLEHTCTSLALWRTGLAQPSLHTPTASVIYPMSTSYSVNIILYIVDICSTHHCTPNRIYVAWCSRRRRVHHQVPAVDCDFLSVGVASRGRRKVYHRSRDLALPTSTEMKVSFARTIVRGALTCRAAWLGRARAPSQRGPRGRA